MRITGGELRGRVLRTPASRHLRPALERVREAIFSIVAARLRGAVVLDAFAGTGLLGLECLSRGAAKAVFIEVHRPTAERLTAVLDEWHLADRADVRRVDFLRAAPALAAEGPFDLVFLDPPYPLQLVDWSLAATAAARLTAADGLVIVKQHHKDTLIAPPGLRVVDQRQYGDSLVTFLENEAEGET